MKIDWLNVIVYVLLFLGALLFTLFPSFGISPWPIVALLAVWVYARRS